jgi:hypothetical protein
MLTIRNTILAGTWLLAPAIALASAGEAVVKVDNRFDGEAEVFVDGRFEGMARANASTTFEVRAGERAIVVSRPGTHYVLAKATVQLPHGSTASIPVSAPTGSLRVDNKGEVALKLEVGSTSVWLQPGTATVLPVETGNVALDASIHDPRGDWKAIERDLWVEPGQLATLSLTPDPTVIVVTNRDSAPVRALLDGADAGWIDPGESERVWVRPGVTNVVLIDRSGQVRSTTALTVTRGNEAKVILAAPPPPPTHVVVVTTGAVPQRPIGAVRPGY